MGVDTHRPAAKMLLALPLLAVTAVTGPGRSTALPMVLQLELLKVNSRTLSEGAADSVIEPPAMSKS